MANVLLSDHPTLRRRPLDWERVEVVLRTGGSLVLNHRSVTAELVRGDRAEQVNYSAAMALLGEHGHRLQIETVSNRGAHVQTCRISGPASTDSPNAAPPEPELIPEPAQPLGEPTMPETTASATTEETIGQRISLERRWYETGELMRLLPVTRSSLRKWREIGRVTWRQQGSNTSPCEILADEKLRAAMEKRGVTVELTGEAVPDEAATVHKAQKTVPRKRASVPKQAESVPDEPELISVPLENITTAQLGVVLRPAIDAAYERTEGSGDGDTREQFALPRLTHAPNVLAWDELPEADPDPEPSAHGIDLNALEDKLARAESLVTLLNDRIHDSGQVDICDMYLSEIIRADLTAAMEIIRPRTSQN